jgi:hypothetical protein
MVGSLGSEPDTGTLIEPHPTPLGLLVRHPEALAPPDAHDPTMADSPAL